MDSSSQVGIEFQVNEVRAFAAAIANKCTRDSYLGYSFINGPAAMNSLPFDIRLVDN